MSSISPFALLLNYPLALMNALNSLRNGGVSILGSISLSWIMIKLIHLF